LENAKLDRYQNAGSMGLKTNVDPNAVSPLPGKPARAAKNGAVLTHRDGLRPAIESAPDTTANAVARARQFIGDADYPSADVIQRIAGLLAIHLEDKPDKAQS
jgi:hypothetical protein